ncbi:GrpB family protein [Dactylosporangium sp. NPDC000521]|uniref:GrpB family protein n=1 Tax=Dactylosporangium sp. NPDC000521 TaxID=3363975 RepID=UPI0036B9D162
MARYPKSITERFHGTPEQLAAGLVGDPPRRWSAVVVDDYDPSWPLRYETTRAALTGALGDLALAVEHVGSTAVPGLPANRELYAGTKRRLAGETADRPGDYSLAKNDVIDAIYAQIFAA